MTDDTQPEAFDLADWLEAVGGGPSAKRCAALLREQHARIAELETELEAVGAGGVQALSAAPAGWKLVPVNPTPEMWKAAKTVPDPNPPYPPHYGLVWDAMLAASPTPPAEQAAPKAAPGEPPGIQALMCVISSLHSLRDTAHFSDEEGELTNDLCTLRDWAYAQTAAFQPSPKAAPTRTALPEGWTDCTIEFGNDGPEVVAYGPKRMMIRLAKWLGKYFAQVIAEAAPKAAPGVGNSGFDYKTAADFLSGKTVSDEALRKFVAASRGAHDARAALHAKMLSLQGELASREAEIALLKKALLEAEAAPQQEAQPNYVVSLVVVKEIPTGVNAQNKLYTVNAASADEAVDKAVLQMPNDFPEHRLHTACFVAIPAQLAPQPAPAPLSEMPYEKQKAIQEGEQIGASDAWFHARHEMLDTLDRRNVFRAGFDRDWSAAIAAQGGKA